MRKIISLYRIYKLKFVNEMEISVELKVDQFPLFIHEHDQYIETM